MAVPTSHAAIVRMRHSSFIAKRIGIGDFSTLNCFCAAHDKGLFAPIEDEPLTFSPKQLVLLHYRALAGQFYKNRNFEESANTELLLIQQRPQDEVTGAQIETCELLSLIGLKATADVSDAFDECQLALDAGQYEKVRALVVRFDAMPSVMAVGAFRPEFDYGGKRLQDLSQPTQTGQYVALHILVADGKAVVVLTWLAANSIARRFVQSFATQLQERLTSLAIQTAFEHVEQVCISPNWWDCLTANIRKPLLDRVRRANSLYEARQRNCLAYRRSYGDWGFQSLKFIHC
jgi:hypothetical protein